MVGIDLIEGEEWKPIKGFEERYAISSFGRLAAFFKGKWKTRRLTNKHGDYLRVVLIAENKKRSISIHRLVAEHFI